MNMLQCKRPYSVRVCMLLYGAINAAEHVADWRPIVRVDYEVFGVFLCFLSKQKYNLVASFVYK